MKLTPDSHTVDELVELIESGRLAIPEFQRPFVWSTAQVADLMSSIARRWPIGSLLLLEGPADFAVRRLGGAPKLTEAKLLILDGQQRVTAIYQALGSRAADEIYVLDFFGLLEDEELGDEHIRARRRSTFLRRYPDAERQARAGLIPLEDLIEDGVFADWVDHLPDEQRQDAFRLRKSQLGGLIDYRIPAVRLERDIEMGALAKIFETINRTGERLKAFDLMVARLYPHGFNLAQAWKDARGARPVFARFKVDGLEPLRLIALSENVRQSRDPETTVRVKGIRQGDVLKIDPPIVRDKWDWAVKSYAAALEFVVEKCGVVDPELLPSPTMLLPAALALDTGGDDARVAVERWWWAAALSQSYAQGANTQAVRDARDLVAELRDGAETPGVVLRFEPDLEVLNDSRRRNESLLRALMSLVVIGGARDWLGSEVLRSSDQELVLHPIFPAGWLEPRGMDPDALMNFTILPAETSAELADTDPHDWLHDPRVSIDAVRSHGLSTDALEANDWQAFSQPRARNFLEQLEALARQGRAARASPALSES